MPNFAGTWKMRSSENFDELLKALGVNAMLRKVAVAAASKPHVEIRQDGDQFYIKTSTTVRTTEINFKVGEGFEEETVDGRKCRAFLRHFAAILARAQAAGEEEEVAGPRCPAVRLPRFLSQVEPQLLRPALPGPGPLSLPTWENENKIHCTQTLLEGDGPKTYWTRELANDELILTFGADDVVCTRIYVRE
uniref:Cytosolic fatty-acid binding proteins domain-containing protein n=1 Tax=Capra hircus TaxID=9925 RepID=A0A8C2P7K2_CAPHI